MSGNDWGYQPGGARLSPRVQKQLDARRRRVAAAWRNDPGREIALVLVFIAALAAIHGIATSSKLHAFEGSGIDAQATYWMESAQRFRYVREVADGRFIPPLDRRMQAPDGYVPWTDTILQEVGYGSLYRLLRPDGDGSDLAPFVRQITRVVSASTIWPLALLALALTRRRDAALLAALAFAIALPVVERGSGIVLFREDVAVPALAWHLALLAWWATSRRWGFALLSGVALAAALLLWKVVTFYYLLLVGFFALAHWTGRAQERQLFVGGALTLLPGVAAVLLPLSLQYDSFATSTPALAAYGVLLGLAGGMLRPATPAWRWAALSGVVFVGLRFLLPGEEGYGHAWETIAARLRHLGEKPADPTLLSFHARHYWGGNYESPTLRRLARDWPWLLAAALPGLLLLLVRLRRRASPPDEPPPRPPATKLLESLGPSEALDPLGRWQLVWMLAALVGSYLLFRKFQLFAAIPLAVFVAYGFAGATRLRRVQRVVIAVLLVGLFLQGRSVIPNLDRLWARQARAEADGVGATVVFSPRSFDELAGKLPELVGEDEPVLASFVISPFLLTYLDRPTVLHCFFEGDLLTRLERIMLARFGSEEELWETARSYGARWYVHEAQQVLRDDPAMSARYIAGAMDWPGDSALVAMQYRPESLKRFELAWENDWFRVFKVLAPGERPRHARRAKDSPIWSEPLFTSLFWKPLGPGPEQPPFPVTPADLLYTTLRAQRSLHYAERQLELGGEEAEGRAERELQEALRIAPYLWEAHALLGDYYRGSGRGDRAAVHRQRADQLRSGLRGASRLPDDIAPVPVPVISR